MVLNVSNKRLQHTHFSDLEGVTGQLSGLQGALLLAMSKGDVTEGRMGIDGVPRSLVGAWHPLGFKAAAGGGCVANAKANRVRLLPSEPVVRIGYTAHRSTHASWRTG